MSLSQFNINSPAKPSSASPYGSKEPQIQYNSGSGTGLQKSQFLTRQSIVNGEENTNGIKRGQSIGHRNPSLLVQNEPEKFSMSSYSPDRRFFSNNKVQETFLKLADSQLTPNVNYVFDSVTEKINEKSDYHHEFKATQETKPFNDPVKEFFDNFNPEQKIRNTKELVNEANKKSHMRDSIYIDVSKKRAPAKLTMTPKSTQNRPTVNLELSSTVENLSFCTLNYVESIQFCKYSKGIF